MRPRPGISPVGSNPVMFILIEYAVFADFHSLNPANNYLFKVNNETLEEGAKYVQS